jgi:hypothetical protein
MCGSKELALGLFVIFNVIHLFALGSYHPYLGTSMGAHH